MPPRHYLEVISKGPRSQHLKEGVVVHVLAHVVQVIVFPTGADALLRVGGTPQPGHGVGWVNGVEEDGLELWRHRDREHRVRSGKGHIWKITFCQ